MPPSRSRTSTAASKRARRSRRRFSTAPRRSPFRRSSRLWRSASSSCRCSSSPASRRYLFVPLAEAGCFAMLSSCFLSRTLVPTMAKFLLRGHEHERETRRRSSTGRKLRGDSFGRLQRGFEHRFERLPRLLSAIARDGHGPAASSIVDVFFLAACLVSVAVLLTPWLGRDFFPAPWTAARSSFTSARGPGPGSRRRPASATRIDGAIRELIPAGTSSTRSSTTSASLTAA